MEKRPVDVFPAVYERCARVAAREAASENLSKINSEVWLSLVERYVRDVEAASSNLVTSIKDIHGMSFFKYDGHAVSLW